MIKADRPRFVFILGMHKSGTSCLAGALERCGLFLGPVSQRALRDPDGFLYEHEEAVRIHSRILAANGGTWYRPPARIVIDERAKTKIRKIAQQLSRHVPCGLKDPRLLLLLDAWTETVGSWALVGTFRHPSSVVRSLLRRTPGLVEEMAWEMWSAYNEQLVRRHRSNPFPIIEFDLGDSEAYCRAVAAAAMELGLSPDMACLREFVRPQLLEREGRDEPTPEPYREVYAYLKEHRYRPPEADDEFQERLAMAEMGYTGWRWSPDKIRQTLYPIARVVPAPLLSLGRRWFRRLDPRWR
ncbi:MAG: hypothetical protein ACUVXD_02145 [Thermodesulfobacteriota bacterium]